jgi:hypothetical protein
LGLRKSDESGIAVSNVGDVNRDGYEDLVIGQRDGSAARSYLIFGRPTMPATIDLANLGSAGIAIVGTASLDGLQWNLGE